MNLEGLSNEEQTAKLIDKGMIDIRAPAVVQVTVNRETGNVWVNVCGVCVFRVSGAKAVGVD